MSHCFPTMQQINPAVPGFCFVCGHFKPQVVLDKETGTVCAECVGALCTADHWLARASKDGISRP